MKTRILVGIPIGVVMIAALIVQSWALAGLFVIISLVCTFEMMQALDAAGAKTIKSVPLVLAAAALPVLYFAGAESLPMVYICGLTALFIVAMFAKGGTFEGLLKSVFVLVYPQAFILFAYLILFRFTNMAFLGSNPVVLVMAIVPTAFCDIFAYFFGRAFGKKKLCPTISPKKTVAGSIWGLAGGVLAAFLIWIFMAGGVTLLRWDMSALHFLVLGAAVAGVSQFGDLAASFVKRYFGIKDYGKILPGHGGILDRVDGIIFALPVSYIYFFVYHATALH